MTVGVDLAEPRDRNYHPLASLWIPVEDVVHQELMVQILVFVGKFRKYRYFYEKA